MPAQPFARCPRAILASVLLSTSALGCSSESTPGANGTGGVSGEVVGGAAGAGGAVLGGAGGMGGAAGAGGTTPVDDGAAPDAPTLDAARSETSGPATAESVCRAAVFAQCERMVQCGLRQSYESCALTANACPNYYFDTGSTRTVESTAQCVAKLQGMSCNEYTLSIYPACTSAGTLAGGAPCRFNSQCESSICQVHGGTCGTCAAAVPVESPCSNATVCAVNSFCNLAVSRCTSNAAVVLGDENAVCGTSVPPSICSGNLVCAGGRCQKPPGAGETCAIDAFRGERCAPGLVCQTGTCVLPEDCGGTNCGASSFCNRAVPAPQCKAYAVEGQPCRAATSDLCKPPLLCIATGDGGAATCGQPAANLGESCAEGTRPCESMLDCSNGRCVSATAALCR
jgi:hypothetical protein